MAYAVVVRLLRMPRNHYTKELLAETVASCTCWAAACRKLGVVPCTGAQSHLTRRAKQFGIDSSHFTGSAWNRGKTFGSKRPITDYLVQKDAPKITPARLRKRLVIEGLLPNKCQHCNRRKWLGTTIPLELDHINGDHFDNRIENLQSLCPNCHAIKTFASVVKRQPRNT